MKVVVKFTIDVEPGGDKPEDGFGHVITKSVTGITREVQSLTKWAPKDVLWLVYKELKETL